MFFPSESNYHNYFLIIDAQNNRVITRVLTILVEFELQNTQSPTKGFEFGSIPWAEVLQFSPILYKTVWNVGLA